jgi:hypothetical protein
MAETAQISSNTFATFVARWVMQEEVREEEDEKEEDEDEERKVRCHPVKMSASSAGPYPHQAHAAPHPRGTGASLGASRPG